MKFVITKDKLTLDCSDGITSDMIYTIDVENDMISSSIKEDVTAAYDISYLQDISKILDSNVRIEIKTEYPILISSDFANSKGNICYMLAPRIED